MGKILLEDNTATTEELNQALVDLGFEPDEAEARGRDYDKDAPVLKKDAKPDSEGKPGVKPAAEPEGKSAAVTETVKDKPQETPPGEELGADGKPKEKAKGGFQKKIETLTSRVDGLREELEEERGDKTRLRQQLDEAKRELEEFRAGTAKPDTEKKDEGPKRPKRPEVPDLSKLDYDTTKYEQAMKEYRVAEDKYDNDLDAYHTTVFRKEAADAVKAQETVKAESEQKRLYDESEAKAYARLDAGRKLIEDWDDTFESIKGQDLALDTSETAQIFMKYEADDPAALYHFFFKDHLEDGGKEGKRVAALTPGKQLIELGKIEDRLAAERNGTKVAELPKAEPKAETPPPAQETPAKPKPVPAKVPDEPIETVGGGGHVSDASLQSLYKQADAAGTAGNHREVNRLLALIQTAERKAAGKVA